MSRLKPGQHTALCLFAAGYSYAEIGESCSWSYSKTNRAFAGVRAALRDPVGGALGSTWQS